MRKTFFKNFTIALWLGYCVMGVPKVVLAHDAGYADLVEKLMPSVVNVRTTREVEVQGFSPFEGLQLPPDHPLRDFFENFLLPRQSPNDGQKRKRHATSLGSGFIIDEAGIVITNYHVVKESDEIFIGLQSGKSYSAEVVGYDERTDIAVLRIQGDNGSFKAVEFGDSNTARVGDFVLAIGNPLGLGGTVTSGIISARSRDINAGPYDDFIQTDASINRGNSGGPLFNEGGEVIGINTAIFSQGGGSIGIGFAIPSVQAQLVVEQLLSYGTTRRGWLGVGIQPVTDAIAESLGLVPASGALVSMVYDGSPASEAGLRSGDVILRFDGSDVENSRRLPFMVARAEVNKRVKIEIWRDGERLVLQVHLGELEKAGDIIAKQHSEDSSVPDDDGSVVFISELGLRVAALSEQWVQNFNLSADEIGKGIVIVGVDTNSKAAEVGLQPGLQILQAGGVVLETPEDLQSAIAEAKSDNKQHILLLLRLKGDMRYIAVELMY